MSDKYVVVTRYKRQTTHDTNIITYAYGPYATRSKANTARSYIAGRDGYDEGLETTVCRILNDHP